MRYLPDNILSAKADSSDAVSMLEHCAPLVGLDFKIPAEDRIFWCMSQAIEKGRQECGDEDVSDIDAIREPESSNDSESSTDSDVPGPSKHVNN